MGRVKRARTGVPFAFIGPGGVYGQQDRGDVSSVGQALGAAAGGGHDDAGKMKGQIAVLQFPVSVISSKRTEYCVFFQFTREKLLTTTEVCLPPPPPHTPFPTVDRCSCCQNSHLVC